MIISMNVSHFVKICQVLTILHQLICQGVSNFGTRIVDGQLAWYHSSKIKAVEPLVVCFRIRHTSLMICPTSGTNSDWSLDARHSQSR